MLLSLMGAQAKRMLVSFLDMHATLYLLFSSETIIQDGSEWIQSGSNAPPLSPCELQVPGSINHKHVLSQVGPEVRLWAPVFRASFESSMSM